MSNCPCLWHQGYLLPKLGLGYKANHLDTTLEVLTGILKASTSKCKDCVQVTSDNGICSEPKGTNSLESIMVRHLCIYPW